MAFQLNQWLPGSRPGSPIPSLSGASVGSASSLASSQPARQRYVAPALRRKEKTLEVQAKIAQLELELEETKAKASKSLGPKLPIFNLPFFLKRSKMEFLQSRFPRTTFRCVSDNAHDHPLAHAETMIAVQKAYRMIAAGSLVVDYYGNAGAMLDFNRAQARSNNPKYGIAYIDHLSPKSYIRHRNMPARQITLANAVPSLLWTDVSEGLDIDLNIDRQRNTLDVPGRGAYTGDKVTWFFKHSLYYLSDDEIQHCLNLEGSSMLAIVHRHPYGSGQMFDGECTYAKKAGVVNQVNVLTGESYTHRDFSWLWDSQTKVKYTSNGAFTWTFHMVSEETWLIELVAVPPHLDERFRSRANFLGVNGAAHELNTHAEAPSQFPHPALADLPDATCVLVGGIPIIRFGDEALPDCKVTCVELYEFLRAAIVGKPRDPDRLQDLFALARSHALSTSAFPGKQNFNVRAEDISSHVILAFVTGLAKETRLLRASLAHSVWAREHQALLDGGGLVGSAPESSVKSAMHIAKRINNARKQSKDTFDAILSVVE